MGVIVYLIFFLRLDSFWIRPWDEAIYSVNAYEMYKHGSYIVPFFDTHPDLWNSKPPLQSWAQICFMIILGYNEIAMRLPSAICGVLTSVYLFFYLKRRFGNSWAWSSFIVLTTSTGFVTYHTARTGDMDSMLTMFLFLTTVFLFRFITEEGRRNRNIFFYFVFLSLAFLTKSFASLLFLPAHLICLLLFGKIKEVLSCRWFYWGLFSFMILIIGYFLLREYYQNGYIDFVLNHDAGQISRTVEGHNHPFDYYFNNFFYGRFAIWISFFAIGVMILFLNEQDKKVKAICLSSAISICIYMLIISIAHTKVFWYDMPVYPLLAIVCGYTCSKGLELIRINSFSKTKQLSIVLVIFFIPIYYAIKNSHDQPIPYSEKKQELLAVYIYEKEKDGYNFDGWKVINKWFSQQILFYKYKLAEKNQTLSIADENNLNKGDKVFLLNEKAKKTIESKYEYRIIDTFNEVTAYEIKAKKDQ